MSETPADHPTDRAALRSRVEAALGTFLHRQRERLALIDAALAPVAESIEALVLGDGKRLRPAFAYWGYRGGGGSDRDDVVTALAALELLQASALIHDDVMDASDTRRGKPSVHRRFEAYHRDGGWHGIAAAFGENAAILAGDLCLVWSDEMLHGAGVDPTALARARPVFDEMRTEVMVGQYLDVLASVTDDTSIERASKIATFKSAKYTVERPLLIGAALADAGPGVEAAYSIYGLALGEAFQLRDDVLGVFGDPSETANRPATTSAKASTPISSRPRSRSPAPPTPRQCGRTWRSRARRRRSRAIPHDYHVVRCARPDRSPDCRSDRNRAGRADKGRPGQRRRRRSQRAGRSSGTPPALAVAGG